MEIKEPQTGGPDRIEDDIVHARMKEATSITVPTEMGQDSITGIPKITPRHGECDTGYSDDSVYQINDVEQYILGTVQTTPQSERKNKGPQTRLRERVDKACHNWTPITVSDLDEMDKTPKKSEGRSARRRRSTKRRTSRSWRGKRCDPRHESRRDALATRTTPTAPGVISD
jgi:hypothetical protein